MNSTKDQKYQLCSEVTKPKALNPKTKIFKIIASLLAAIFLSQQVVWANPPESQLTDPYKENMPAWQSKQLLDQQSIKNDLINRKQMIEGMIRQEVVDLDDNTTDNDLELLQFNGSNNYIDCETDPAFDLTQELTIDVWACLDNSYNDYLVAKRDVNNSQYGLYINKYGNLKFMYQNDYKAKSKRISSRDFYGDTDLHHIVVTVSGVNLKAYIDGSQVYSGKLSNQLISEPDVPVYIGARKYNSGIRNSFAGRMGKVSIYNRAVTASEVLDEYSGSDIEEGRVLNWTSAQGMNYDPSIETGGGAPIGEIIPEIVLSDGTQLNNVFLSDDLTVYDAEIYSGNMESMIIDNGSIISSRDNEGITYHFSSEFMLERMHSVGGGTALFTYIWGESGDIAETSVTENGETAFFSNDGSINKISLLTGEFFEYEHLINGMVVKEFDSYQLLVAEYKYDTNDHLTSILLNSGAEYLYYVPSRRIRSITTVEDGVTYEYMDEDWNGYTNGRLIKVIDPDGSYIEYESYFDNGDQPEIVAEYTDEGVKVFKTTYFLDGSVHEEVTYVINESGERVGIVLEHYTGEIFEYSSNWVKLRKTDINGDVTVYNYDISGDYLGKAVSKEYFEGTDVAKWGYEYNSEDNKIHRTKHNEDGTVSEFVTYYYDESWVRTAIVQEYYTGAVYEFNADWLRLKDIEEDGDIVIYHYDDDLNYLGKTKSKDHFEGTDQPKFIYEYNADNNVIKNTEFAVNGDTLDIYEYTLDSNGNEVKVLKTYSSGHVTEFAIIDHEWIVLVETELDGTIKERHYDDNWNLTGVTETRPDGIVYEIDEYWRKRIKRYPDGRYKTYEHYYEDSYVPKFMKEYDVEDNMTLLQVCDQEWGDILLDEECGKYTFYDDGRIHTVTYTESICEYADEDIDGSAFGRIYKETGLDGSYTIYEEYYEGTTIPRYENVLSVEGEAISTREYDANGVLVEELIYAEINRDTDADGIRDIDDKDDDNDGIIDAVDVFPLVAGKENPDLSVRTYTDLDGLKQEIASKKQAVKEELVLRTEFEESPKPVVNPLSLNGDQSYVDCGNDSSLDLTSEFTLEATLRVGSRERGYIIAKRDGNDAQYSLFVENGHLEFMYYDGFSVKSENLHGVDIGDNKYHQIIVTVEDLVIKVFVDGVLETVYLLNAPMKSFPEVPVYIGARKNGSQSAYNLDCDLVDVRIYSEALEMDDVMDRLGGTDIEKGLVANWDFSGANGPVLVDKEGQNNGVIHSGIWLSESEGPLVPNGMLRFNRNGEYVDCGINTGYDLIDSFTLETTVNLDRSAYGKILTKGAEGLAIQYGLKAIHGDLYFQYNENGMYREFRISTGCFNSNEPTHIVVTLSNRTLRTYIDGSLQSTEVLNIDLENVQGTQVTVGAHKALGQYFEEIDGYIKQVSIYDRVLTENEIFDRYFKDIHVKRNLILNWTAPQGYTYDPTLDENALLPVNMIYNNLTLADGTILNGLLLDNDYNISNVTVRSSDNSQFEISSGTVVSSIDKDGNTYYYDEEFMLDRIVNSDLSVNMYSYLYDQETGSLLETVVTDDDGSSHYAPNGTLLKVCLVTGEEYVYSQFINGIFVNEYWEGDIVATYLYDAYGSLMLVDKSGSASCTYYIPSGRAHKVLSKGVISVYSDENWNGFLNGKLIRKLFPDNTSDEYTDYYDDTDQFALVNHYSEELLTMTSEYDVDGNLIGTTDHLLDISYRYFLPSGRVQKKEYPDSRIEEFYDEDAGRLFRVTDASGASCEYLDYYGQTDQAKFEIDATVDRSKYLTREYSETGELICEIDNESCSTRTFYDSGTVRTKKTIGGYVEEYLDEDWDGRGYGRVLKRMQRDSSYVLYEGYQEGLDQAATISEYDSTGYLETVSTYNSDGNIISLVHSDGNRDIFNYVTEGDKIVRVVSLNTKYNDLSVVDYYDYDNDLISGMSTGIGELDGDSILYNTGMLDDIVSASSYDQQDNVTRQVEHIYSTSGTEGDLDHYIVREYDADYNIVTVTEKLNSIELLDPEAVTLKTTTYTYDSEGNITSVSDGEGNGYEYEYELTPFEDKNVITRLLTRDIKSGTVVIESFDLAGRSLERVGRPNVICSYTPNLKDQGYMSVENISYTDAFGNMIDHSITSEYDADGHLVRYIDSFGNTTTYMYGPDNRIQSEAHAYAGSLIVDVTEYEYNYPIEGVEEVTTIFTVFTDNTRSEMIREERTVRKVETDADNTILKESVTILNGEEPQTTIYEYPDENSTIVTTSHGSTVEYINILDNRGRLVERRTIETTQNILGEPIVSTEVSVYAPETGNLVSMTDKDLNVITYITSRDEKGNVIRVQENSEFPESKVTIKLYEANGNLKELSETVEGSETTTTSYSYNNEGKINTVEYPDGKIESYIYSYHDDGSLNTYKVIVTADGEDDRSMEERYNIDGDTIWSIGNDGIEYSYDYIRDEMGALKMRIVNTLDETGSIIDTSGYDAKGNLVYTKDYSKNIEHMYTYIYADQNSPYEYLQRVSEDIVQELSDNNEVKISVSRSFDKEGQVTEIDAGGGSATVYDYYGPEETGGLEGDLRSIIDVDGKMTVYTYTYDEALGYLSCKETKIYLKDQNNEYSLDYSYLSEYYQDGRIKKDVDRYNAETSYIYTFTEDIVTGIKETYKQKDETGDLLFGYTTEKTFTSDGKRIVTEKLKDSRIKSYDYHPETEKLILESAGNISVEYVYDDVTKALSSTTDVNNNGTDTAVDDIVRVTTYYGAEGEEKIKDIYTYPKGAEEADLVDLKPVVREIYNYKRSGALDHVDTKTLRSEHIGEEGNIVEAEYIDSLETYYGVYNGIVKVRRKVTRDGREEFLYSEDGRQVESVYTEGIHFSTIRKIYNYQGDIVGVIKDNGTNEIITDTSYEKNSIGEIIGKTETVRSVDYENETIVSNMIISVTDYTFLTDETKNADTPLEAVTNREIKEMVQSGKTHSYTYSYDNGYLETSIETVSWVENGLNMETVSKKRFNNDGDVVETIDTDGTYSKYSYTKPELGGKVQTQTMYYELSGESYSLYRPGIETTPDTTGLSESVVIRTYDFENDLVSVVKKNGEGDVDDEITTYLYEKDEYGNILKQYEKLSGREGVTISEFNEAQDLVAEVDRNGVRNAYGYSRDLSTGSIVLVEVTNDLYPEYMESTTYDEYGNVSETVDNSGITRSYSYEKDLRGILLSKTERTYLDTDDLKIDYTETYNYDINGDVTQYSDKNGTINESQYLYDRYGTALSMTTISSWVEETKSKSKTVKREYNTDGTENVVTYVNYPTDPTSMVVKEYIYTYDEISGVLVQKTESTIKYIGSTQSRYDIIYTYNVFGDLISVRAPNGTVVSYTIERDTSGRTVKKYSTNSIADLSVEMEEYDLLGNKVARVDANGYEYNYVNTYDLKGNLTATVTTHTIDDASAIEGWTSSELSEYDIFGRITASSGRNGTKFSYTYVTDERGEVVESYEYDPRYEGAVVKTFDPKTGDMLSSVNRLGQKAEFQYTRSTLHGGIVEKREIAPLGGTTTYHMDDKGRIVKNTDKNGRDITIAMNFDAYGNMVDRTLEWEETINGERQQFQETEIYSLNGDLSGRIDYLGDRFEYLYQRDDQGNIGCMTTVEKGKEGQEKTNMSSVSYDDNGRVASRMNKTGEVTYYHYELGGFGEVKKVFEGIRPAVEVEVMVPVTPIDITSTGSDIEALKLTDNALSGDQTITEGNSIIVDLTVDNSNIEGISGIGMAFKNSKSWKNCYRVYYSEGRSPDNWILVSDRSNADLYRSDDGMSSNFNWWMDEFSDKVDAKYIKIESVRSGSGNDLSLEELKIYRKEKQIDALKVKEVDEYGRTISEKNALMLIWEQREDLREIFSRPNKKSYGEGYFQDKYLVDWAKHIGCWEDPRIQKYLNKYVNGSYPALIEAFNSRNDDDQIEYSDNDIDNWAKEVGYKTNADLIKYAENTVPMEDQAEINTYTYEMDNNGTFKRKYEVSSYMGAQLKYFDATGRSVEEIECKESEEFAEEFFYEGDEALLIREYDLSGNLLSERNILGKVWEECSEARDIFLTPSKEAGGYASLKEWAKEQVWSVGDALYGYTPAGIESLVEPYVAYYAYNLAENGDLISLSKIVNLDQQTYKSFSVDEPGDNLLEDKILLDGTTHSSSNGINGGFAYDNDINTSISRSANSGGGESNATTTSVHSFDKPYDITSLLLKGSAGGNRNNEYSGDVSGHIWIEWSNDNGNTWYTVPSSQKGGSTSGDGYSMNDTVELSLSGNDILVGCTDIKAVAKGHANGGSDDKWSSCWSNIYEFQAKGPHTTTDQVIVQRETKKLDVTRKMRTYEYFSNGNVAKVTVDKTGKDSGQDFMIYNESGDMTEYSHSRDGNYNYEYTYDEWNNIEKVIMSGSRNEENVFLNNERTFSEELAKERIIQYFRSMLNRMPKQEEIDTFLSLWEDTGFTNRVRGYISGLDEYLYYSSPSAVDQDMAERDERLITLLEQYNNVKNSSFDLVDNISLLNAATGTYDLRRDENDKKFVMEIFREELGREVTDAEIEAELYSIRSMNIADYKAEVSSNVEKAARRSEIETVIDTLYNDGTGLLIDYLNAENKAQYLEGQGYDISSEDLVDISVENIQNIISWLRSQDNHFGRSAVESLYKQLREAGTEELPEINALLTELIFIDILTGVINEHTQGMLLLSMFAIKKVSLKYDLNLYGTNYDLEEFLSKFDTIEGYTAIIQYNNNHFMNVTSVIKDAQGNITHLEVTNGYIEGVEQKKTIEYDKFKSNFEGKILASERSNYDKRLTDKQLMNIKGAGWWKDLWRSVEKWFKGVVKAVKKIINYIVEPIVQLVKAIKYAIQEGKWGRVIGAIGILVASVVISYFAAISGNGALIPAILSTAMSMATSVCYGDYTGALVSLGMGIVSIALGGVLSSVMSSVGSALQQVLTTVVSVAKAAVGVLGSVGTAIMNVGNSIYMGVLKAYTFVMDKAASVMAGVRNSYNGMMGMFGSAGKYIGQFGQDLVMKGISRYIGEEISETKGWLGKIGVGVLAASMLMASSSAYGMQSANERMLDAMFQGASLALSNYVGEEIEDSMGEEWYADLLKITANTLISTSFNVMKKATHQVIVSGYDENAIPINVPDERKEEFKDKIEAIAKEEINKSQIAADSNDVKSIEVGVSEDGQKGIIEVRNKYTNELEKVTMYDFITGESKTTNCLELKGYVYDVVDTVLMPGLMVLTQGNLGQGMIPVDMSFMQPGLALDMAVDIVRSSLFQSWDTMNNTRIEWGETRADTIILGALTIKGALESTKIGVNAFKNTLYLGGLFTQQGQQLLVSEIAFTVASASALIDGIRSTLGAIIGNEKMMDSNIINNFLGPNWGPRVKYATTFVNLKSTVNSYKDLLTLNNNFDLMKDISQLMETTISTLNDLEYLNSKEKEYVF